MMLSVSVRLCNVPLAPVMKAATAKAVPIIQTRCAIRLNTIRTFADDAREYMSRAARRRATLKEGAFAPAGETAFNVGKGALAGGSVLGLGALCYYGLGMSSEVGAIDKAVVWPQYVRDRIKSTYMYFGGSIALSAVCAAAALRSPTLLHFVAKNSFMSIAVTLAAMIGSGVLVQSIPYKEGFGSKQLAWMAHTAIVGCVIAPICLLGGPIITRAAWYTAGVVGGLSTVAVCAPSEKFLKMGGPLAIGLGVVIASSFGSMFLPPTTALGAGLYSLSMYGGLLLFSGFMLYDTQRIVKMAEEYPLYAVRPYDPINSAISIYLDTVNIFIRIAMILASGGQRRK